MPRSDPAIAPTYFADAQGFGAWLERHGAAQPSLLVGFHKVGSSRPSMRWSESVDEALCHGWIDGVRKRIDDDAYTIRFTPRKPNSIWSAVNIAKVEALQAQGRMRPAGLAAYALRSEHKSRVYAYEQASVHTLDAAEVRLFEAHVTAWAYFTKAPAGYRKVVLHWVVGAKQATTRQRRLSQLIDACAAGIRLR